MAARAPGIVLFFLLLGGSSSRQLDGAPDMASVLKQTKDLVQRLSLLESNMISSQREMQTQIGTMFNAFSTEMTSNFTAGVSAFKEDITQTLSGTDADEENLKMIARWLKTSAEEMDKLRWNYAKVKLRGNCSKGWVGFEDSCYFFSDVGTNWTNARDSCVEMGCDLVKITTDEEWHFLANLLSVIAWVGLNNLEDSTTWRWSVDNSVDTLSNHHWWHTNQPDNWQGQENCIGFWKKDVLTLLNDFTCSWELPYICEMAAPSKASVQ